MATKTFEELKQMAIQIRDEKANKQNTATRIGTQMVEHLNKLEQEYYNKENIDEQKEQTDAKFSWLIKNNAGDNNTFQENCNGYTNNDIPVGILEFKRFIKGVYIKSEKKEGFYYSFAAIETLEGKQALCLYSNNKTDATGTIKRREDYIFIDTSIKEFVVQDSKNGVFTILWNPSLCPGSINSAWYDIAGLSDSCWDENGSFFLSYYNYINGIKDGIDVIKKQINAKILSSGVINVDTANKKVRIPTCRITTYKNVIVLDEPEYIIDMSEYADLIVAIYYDIELNTFGTRLYTKSFSDNEIIVLYVNIAQGFIYGDGLKDSNYKVNGEYANKAGYALSSDLQNYALKEEINNLFQKYISNDWNLAEYVDIYKTSLIAKTNLPANNTQLSFYNKILNAWWIEAEVNNDYNEKPLSQTTLSIGLILSERGDNDFRMVKLNANSQGNKELVYYTRNNNAWFDYKLFQQEEGYYETTNPLKVNIRAAICGRNIQVYENNTFIGYAESRSVPSDSRYTMKAGILHNAPNNAANNIRFGIRPTPYVHFSVDDVGNSLKRVTTNAESLNSIFEDDFYKFWKEMHDLYGVVVTMNVFYSIGSDGSYWDLTSMTNKFKEELTSNSSWLKFAFHGGNETIKYNDEANNEAGITAYQNTVNQIVRFASLSNLDKFPRLSFFSGNKNFLNSLKSQKLLIGCLTADDTRADNCGLTEMERNCINSSADYIDFENKLYYIRSSTRLDAMNEITSKNLVLNELNNPTRSVVMEYFFHETTSSTVLNAAKAVIKTLNEHNVRFDFPQNNMPF